MGIRGIWKNLGSVVVVSCDSVAIVRNGVVWCGRSWGLGVVGRTPLTAEEGWIVGFVWPPPPICG